MEVFGGVHLLSVQSLKEFLIVSDATLAKLQESALAFIMTRDML